MDKEGEDIHKWLEKDVSDSREPHDIWWRDCRYWRTFQRQRHQRGTPLPPKPEYTRFHLEMLNMSESPSTSKFDDEVFLNHLKTAQGLQVGREVVIGRHSNHLLHHSTLNSFFQKLISLPVLTHQLLHLSIMSPSQAHKRFMSGCESPVTCVHLNSGEDILNSLGFWWCKIIIQKTLERFDDVEIFHP